MRAEPVMRREQSRTGSFWVMGVALCCMSARVLLVLHVLYVAVCIRWVSEERSEFRVGGVEPEYHEIGGRHVSIYPLAVYSSSKVSQYHVHGKILCTFVARVPTTADGAQ